MKLKLLIVEDHEPIQELFRTFIGDYNELDFASNGIDGFSLARQKQYDLIISDLNLPEMEGLEMMRRLRESDVRTPFIVITGHNTLKNEIDSFRLGALDFLVKPFSFDTVSNILERFKKNFLSQKKIKSSKSVFLKSKINLFTIDSVMGEIPDYVEIILSEIHSLHGVKDSDLLVLKVVLFELLANAIEHGNAGVGYLEKQEMLEKEEKDYIEHIDSICMVNKKKVYVELSYSQAEIRLTIQDEGSGFNPTAVPDPTINPRQNILSGRGIFIAKLNIDKLEYNEKGNIVTAIRKLDDMSSEKGQKEK